MEGLCNRSNDIPSSPEVDIAIFEPNEKVAPYNVTPAENSTPLLGQQVSFLGFPYGIYSSFPDGRVAPFVKSGTMSAMDSSKPDALIMYIDGFNNPGFSGGPILYWDYKLNRYQIFGVVKGYRHDNATTIINEKVAPSREYRHSCRVRHQTRAGSH